MIALPRCLPEDYKEMSLISFRPQLRTLLLMMNVLVLLLPVGGIVLLKMYESELIRQTESALIGQAALLSSIYGQELALEARREQVSPPYSATLPADSPFHSFALYTPITPLLDAAKSEVLAPGPAATHPDQPADIISRTVGNRFISILKESQRITLCGIRIVDSRAVVVASSGSEMGLSLSNRIEVGRALEGYYSSVLRQRISDEPTPSFFSLSRKAWVRVLVALPVIHNQRIVGAVLLSRSPVGVGKGLYFIRRHLLVAGLVAFSLVITITWITNVVISRPLRRLVDRAKKVQAQGGRLENLAHPGTREIAELSTSLSEMADTLQKRAEYIQNFARHVSHEFKTPITAIQGSVELMQDTAEDMTPAQRQRFLDNMSQDIRHLDRLTRGLLELARADMIAPGTASCRPEIVIQEMAEEYQSSGREVNISIPAGPQPLQMEAEVLRGILVNLVENSFSHGHASQVQIALNPPADRKKEPAVITITDNGRGIAPAHHDKIFTPFFTTARNRGGTGLGLAISKALVEGHGGELALTATSTEGNCQFTLRLPWGQA